jgi:hypothetical protein
MRKQFIYIMLAAAAILAACSDDNKNGEYKPEVIINPVTDITVDGMPADGTLLFEGLGSTKQLQAAASPANGGDADRYYFRYASSDEKVFTVTDDGLVKAIGPGEAALTVTPLNNIELRKQYKVVVMIYITDLTVPAEAMMKAGDKYDLSLQTIITPDNATYRTLKYASSNESVATVSDKGVINALAGGHTTITVSTTDGTNISRQCAIEVLEWLDRTGWTVDTSARYATGNNYVVDGDTGKPEDIIDGNQSTFLSLVKPGKTYNGCSAAANDPFYFVVDMQTKQTFNYLKWMHRAANTTVGLRAKKITLSGSNDGVTYTPIQENITIPTSDNTTPIEIPLPTSTYRIVKVDYTDWDKNANSTVQIGEFLLGTTGE